MYFYFSNNSRDHESSSPSLYKNHIYILLSCINSNSYQMLINYIAWIWSFWYDLIMNPSLNVLEWICLKMQCYYLDTLANWVKTSLGLRFRVLKYVLGIALEFELRKIYFWHAFRCHLQDIYMSVFRHRSNALLAVLF